MGTAAPLGPGSTIRWPYQVVVGFDFVKKCPVCDLEHSEFEAKCRECGVRMKKGSRKRGRSKKSKGKDKYKRKRPECNGNKRVYASLGEAHASSRAQFRDGKGLRAYWCKTCSGYHLTKLVQGR